MYRKAVVLAPSASPISSFLPSSLRLVVRSRPSRPLPTVPLELQLLILQLAGQHRVALHLIDTERNILANYPFLRSACLVSRDWNIDATKLLYAHLVLPTTRAFESILQTLASAEPRVFELVTSISLRGVLGNPAPYQLLDDLILRGWPSLKRLVTPHKPADIWKLGLLPRLEVYELLNLHYPTLVPAGAEPLISASKVWRIPPSPHSQSPTASINCIALDFESKPLPPASASQLRTLLHRSGARLTSLRLGRFTDRDDAVASPSWVFTLCPLLRTLFIPLDFLWPESPLDTTLVHGHIERLIVHDPTWTPHTHWKPYRPFPSPPYDPTHLLAQMSTLIDKDVGDLLPNLLSISLFPISFEDDEELKSHPSLFFVLEDLRRLYPSIRLEDRLGTEYDPRWSELDGVEDEEAGDVEVSEEQGWVIEV